MQEGYPQASEQNLGISFKGEALGTVRMTVRGGLAFLRLGVSDDLPFLDFLRFV
ncbi:hypothetical protein PQR14_19515 [Paraburkholderia bryophila]|uniref:hypothetical protein n=1 Tax=Burkholderiaceae TaxID=119060 RepID=UPI000AC7615D|nr:hypothetical protein [Burkholderia sp. 9120]